ncbi:MAG: hypothetical protein LQ342_005168 [Letrouitia transgressa]|nr:MAG: hypothetical protein LQ342_005168 [Letrouitia transgressa]
MDRDRSTRGRLQTAINVVTAVRQSPEGWEDEVTRGQERKRKGWRPPRDPEPPARPPYAPYGENWAGIPAISGQQLPPYHGQGSSPPPPPLSYSSPNTGQQQLSQYQGQGSSPPPLPLSYSSPNTEQQQLSQYQGQGSSPPPQTNVHQPYYHNPPSSNPNTFSPPGHSYFYNQSSGHHYFNQSQQPGNNLGYTQSYHSGTQTNNQGQGNNNTGYTQNASSSPPLLQCEYCGEFRP